VNKNTNYFQKLMRKIKSKTKIIYNYIIRFLIIFSTIFLLYNILKAIQVTKNTTTNFNKNSRTKKRFELIEQVYYKLSGKVYFSILIIILLLSGMFYLSGKYYIYTYTIIIMSFRKVG